MQPQPLIPISKPKQAKHRLFINLNNTNIDRSIKNPKTSSHMLKTYRTNAM